MKHFLLLLMTVLICIKCGFAEDAEIQSVFVSADATITPDLYIKFKVNHEINLIKSADVNIQTKWELRRSSNNEPFWLAQGVGFFADSVVWFRMSDVEPKTIDLLFDSDNPGYLQVAKDIVIVDTEGNEYLLSTKQIKDQTLLMLSISEDAFGKVIKETTRAKFLSEDYFDLSREVNAGDSSASEFVLSFEKSESLVSKQLYYRGKGRLSSDSHSPLNQLNFTIGYIWDENAKTSLDRPLLYNVLFEGTITGNQTLDTAVGKLRFAFEGLAPNLIDISGGSNRLRLKPVVKAGAGVVSHFRKLPLYDNAEVSFELFLNCYYYIPVLDEYAIIYEAEANYNKERKLNDGFTLKNSLTLAYDLPLSDLKALFKWETGKNEFLYKTESQILLGLLINYVPI